MDFKFKFKDENWKPTFAAHLYMQKMVEFMMEFTIKNGRIYDH